MNASMAAKAIMGRQMKIKNMKHAATSIRSFIGAKNFNESREFYNELGFEEVVISEGMSYFRINEKLGFYLQNYYAEDWINNFMLFLEVDNANEYFTALKKLNLHAKFKTVKLTPVKNHDWGDECFLHDPSGVLWHFGHFNKK